MERKKFAQARAQLGKTQKALAELLGVSLKAVQSYEQGWRSIPAHIEKQIYFLLVNQRGTKKPTQKECWHIKNVALKKSALPGNFKLDISAGFSVVRSVNVPAKKAGRKK